MRVAILADQHGTLPEIPECDLLILSGDLTGGNPHGPRDSSDDKWRLWLHTKFQAWIRWIQLPEFVRKERPAARIFIAGNHDTAFSTITGLMMDLMEESGYIQDRRVKVNTRAGSAIVYGTPWIRQWDTLAFNLPEDKLKAKWAEIPDDTDILVCHQPPLGYGDDGKGCPHLTERIRQIKPKLVTCGHIHEGRGVYDLDGTMVVNASGGFITVEI